MTRAARALCATVLVALSSVTLGAGPAQAAFGLKPNLDVTFTALDGAPAMQAGSHPFAMTTTLDFNTLIDPEHGEVPDGAAKDLTIELPPGMVGDPSAVPRCSSAVFLESITEEGHLPCPDDTVVGVITAKIGSEGPESYSLPIYNLAPPPGAIVKLGFIGLLIPVTLEIRLKSTPPYNAVVSVTNISQATRFYGSKAVIWGNPANSAHDTERGSCAISDSEDHCPVSTAERPFLTMPRSCAGPLRTSFAVDSWQDPGTWLPYNVETHDNSFPVNPLGTVSCAKLGFAPSITAQPTTRAAQSPTGLDFSLDVHDEGLTNPTGNANADIEKAVVTLPEGMSTNPSIAEGLSACSEEDLRHETLQAAPGEGCPQSSKIGSVEVETPLLEETVDGALYIAKPYENEFGSLLALYIVLKSPTLGILVKQAARVEPDPKTGRLVTIAENLPQLPFSHFKLHFREGTRSPLASPPACGTYNASAVLTPSSGGAPITTSSAFQIISGPGAGPCPSGGVPPFHPGLVAGTLNNAAGHYSPFNLRLSRVDGEQEFTRFSIKLPPGLVGKLAGIPFCPDASIETAKTRTGTAEIEHPSCPAASAVGRTLVGAGVGPSLVYVPGKVYLAGPYHGSALSIAAITAAKVGPFDLGTVVVRQALKIDPETAEVFIDAAGSDPIPHIIDGIPVHARDIRVYVDRPEFVLNPTDCTQTSTTSTVLGSGLNFSSDADDRPVTVTSRFQAADCASLGFKPKLALSLKGGTHRGDTPKFRAVLTYPKGSSANIAKAQVTLPHSEFLEQAHIKTICTRTRFAEGNAPGEKCPPGSIYGYAKAITPLLSEPLKGPVFLRSSSHNLPDLVAALHSGQINIVLDGRIDSVKGGRIRNTFEAVPDAPVTKFILELQGGKKGLLVNSTNICRARHRALADFTGQNGKVHNFKPVLKAECGRHPEKDKSRLLRPGW